MGLNVVMVPTPGSGKSLNIVTDVIVNTVIVIVSVIIVIDWAVRENNRRNDVRCFADVLEFGWNLMKTLARVALICWISQVMATCAPVETELSGEGVVECVELYNCIGK